MANFLPKNSLITVIVPFFNAENYLRKCIESILKQTHTNLEIIMVDDGSTDGSSRIVEEYIERDFRIKLIQQENKGAGAARNRGLEEAKGDYIGFVDSDDWIAHDMYEYLLALMIRNEADITACDYVSTKDRGCEDIPISYEELKVMNQTQLFEFFLRVHGERSYSSAWNMLYRKDIIWNVRFPEGKITEDLMFDYLAYKKCNKYVFSNQRKYFYFYNRNGVTRSKLKRLDLALLEYWDYISSDISTLLPQLEPYAVLNRWRADFTLLSKAVLFGYDKEQISREEIVVLRKQLRKHSSALLKSNMLDWKRKILLLICCCK